MGIEAIDSSAHNNTVWILWICITNTVNGKTTNTFNGQSFNGNCGVTLSEMGQFVAIINGFWIDLNYTALIRQLSYEPATYSL